MRYLYLHGFASGPASRKARFFVDKLAACGIRLDVLDLAPDFQNLTLTSQLKVIEQAAHGEAVSLVGSSLGGYLAALYAAVHPEVERLLLLAPAFDFVTLWREKLGVEALAEWQGTGIISVYHYGMGKQTTLGYQFLLDAERYPAFPHLDQPCLVLHGVHDSVVSSHLSVQFQAKHPATTRVHLLPSGHELTDVLNEIWNYSKNFLAINLSPSGADQRNIDSA